MRQDYRFIKENANNQYRQSTKRMASLLILNGIISLFIWQGVIGHLLWYVALTYLALTFGFIIIKYLAEYIVFEGSTVILKTGVLSSQTMEVPLDKINAVKVRRGLFGRMFDYGTLFIYTGNDTSGIKFVGLNRPDMVKQKLKP